MCHKLGKFFRVLTICFLPYLFILSGNGRDGNSTPPSGDVFWRNIGPGGGGWIQSLAFDPKDPNKLYLGCDVGGLYVSDDFGRHFQIRNEGLTDYFVECIAVNPHNPKIILLGTQGGIFRTTDGGESWQKVTQGFPPPQRYSYSSPIGAISFDPQNPAIVYAGIGRPRQAREGGNGQAQGAIYKSEDGGITWWRIDGGQLPSDAVISDIEVKPDDSSVILVATNKGVFRSDDGGESWKPSNDGLPHLFAQELAFAPSQPNRVYLSLLTTARGGQAWNGGIYRSDDGGKTWRDCTGNLSRKVGKSLYEQDNYNEIVVHPTNSDIVYIGGRSWWDPGIYKTEDGGKSWEGVSRHIPPEKNMDYGWIDFWGPSVECLAISPADPDRLAFGTSGHLFLSSDGGKSWHQAYCQVFPDGRFRGNGLEVTCLNSVIPDPLRHYRLYLCYADIGLLISEDGGLTFRRSFVGMKGEGNCFTVAIDPKSPDTIWAGTGQWAWNEGYICKSEDGGKTWRVVGEERTGLPKGQVKNIIIDLKSPVGKRRLIVTVNGYGFYQSNDGGESWHSINGDLPSEAVRYPRGILLDPKDSRHLVVACSGPPKVAGVYESFDGGKSWKRLDEGQTFVDIQSISADPNDFSKLYLAVREYYDHQEQMLYPGGAFKSIDGGRKWERILDYHFLSHIVPSPAGDIIYATTTDHPYHDNCVAEGVLKSSDGGKTWRKVNEGLSHLNISCLAIDPLDPSRLYLGTGGNGAFIGRDWTLAPPLCGGFWQISSLQAKQFLKDEDIDRLVKEIARAGLKTNIVQFAGWEVEGNLKTLYPSRSYPQMEEWKGRDPLEVLLRSADEVRGEVYLGLAPLLTAEPKPQELKRWEEESMRILKELWGIYSKHTSLKGFYLPPEVHYNSSIEPLAWRELLDRFADAVHSLSGNLKLIVPIGLYLRKVGQTWLRALPQDLSPFWLPAIRESKVDVFLLIDGIGTALSDFRSSEDCQRWLAEECRRSGKELWVEVEAFDTSYNACDIDRFKRQITMAYLYADRILTFDIPHYFAPNALAPKAKELYNNYKDMFLPPPSIKRGVRLPPSSPNPSLFSYEPLRNTGSHHHCVANFTFHTTYTIGMSFVFVNDQALGAGRTTKPTGSANLRFHFHSEETETVGEREKGT